MTKPKPSFPRRLLRPLRILLVLYLLILLVFMLLETKLVFPAPRTTAASVDATEFGGVDVHFTSADGTKLHGQYFDHPNSRDCILYCHGNGIMVSQMSEYGDWMRSEYGYSVFIFDYRGYGISEGKPTGEGVLADAVAAHQWLIDNQSLTANDIVLMGRSLGGALAVHVAAERGARGLVLQNTFASLVDTAAKNYPWLPVRTMMKTRLDSREKITAYNGPLLQSHGSLDRIIPFEQGRELFEHAPGPKEFFTVEDGRHNTHNPPEYIETLNQFLSRHQTRP